MAVQFILGRSGTGKTTKCLEQITQRLQKSPTQKPLILLVPEQATYQAEQAILHNKKITAYNRLHVLSFARLSFMLTGKNIACPELSSTGRQMIIHRILREHRSRLQIFGPSALSAGVSREMANAVTILSQCLTEDIDLEKTISQLDETGSSLMAMKLHDVQLILNEYTAFIENRFHDSNAEIRNICSAASKSTLVKDAEIWVDGFSGFSAGETALLTELLKYSANTTIALCLDPAAIDIQLTDKNELDPASLFYPTELTYASLLQITNKCRLKLDHPLILNTAHRFSNSPALQTLERSIFTFDNEKVPADNSIRIYSTANPRAESRFVARQVSDLVRNQGMRCRDIAVIASDLDNYEHYIRAYFDEYGLSYFIDKRQVLSEHPLVELVMAALSLATDGFSDSEALAFIKSDLGPLPTRTERDILENYCLANGISPRDWQYDKPWQFEQPQQHRFDEELVNKLRKTVTRHITKLKTDLTGPDGKIDAHQFTTAVFNLLDELQTTETIKTWIEQAQLESDYAAVEVHRQVFDKFVQVFDELAEIFTTEKLTAPDFASIIASAFEQLTLGLIPPTLDQVLVGSIERSRHPNLKAVFLLGTTQKSFPVPVSSTGLFMDRDLAAAEQVGLELGDGTKRQLSERQYLAYIAFTRPCDLLCVTYPVADSENKAQVRSQFVGSLETLFTDLKEQTANVHPDIEHVSNRYELQDLMCSALGRDQGADIDQNARAKAKQLLDSKSFQTQLSDVHALVAEAITYSNEPALDSDIIAQLFKRDLLTSASRLGTFAKCPYLYFAKYTLALKERAEFKLKPLEMGIFYHAVLEQTFNKLAADNINIDQTSEPQLRDITKTVCQQVIEHDAFISKFTAHSQHNAFMISEASETVEDCIVDIAEMITAGTFRPWRTEVAFDIDGDIEPLTIELKDGKKAIVRGKIDRLDTADIDGKKTALIFDYKSSSQRFDWNRFYNGLAMQLPIYLQAAKNSKNIDDVAGAFFVPIKLPNPSKELTALDNSSDTFERRTKGLFNAAYTAQLDHAHEAGQNPYYDFFVKNDGDIFGKYKTASILKPEHYKLCLDFARDKIAQLSQRIISGDIAIAPYKKGGERACENCPFKPLCRFDWQINDYNYIPSMDKTDFFDSQEADDAKD